MIRVRVDQARNTNTATVVWGKAAARADYFVVSSLGARCTVMYYLAPRCGPPCTRPARDAFPSADASRRIIALMRLARPAHRLIMGSERIFAADLKAIPLSAANIRSDPHG